MKGKTEQIQDYGSLFQMVSLPAAVAKGCSLQKEFLKISKNSDETINVGVSFLVKLQASSCNLIKKRLWHRCFPVKFANFLRTPFL